MNILGYFVRCILLFAFVLSAQALWGQTPQKKSSKTTTKPDKKQADKEAEMYEAYRGMWFGLYFPRDWQIRPSLQGSQGEDNSVFFTAPDSSAEFYVFCPRYSGKPTDIEVNYAIENQIGQTIEEKDGVRIRTVRIMAKDSTYSRIFEDTVAFMVGRRLVFGFKFRDAKALKKYDPIYVYFKKSFRKFTD